MTCALSFSSPLSLHLSLLILMCPVVGVQSASGDGRSLWQQPPNKHDFLSATFPTGFLWGVGTSAFSTEGSWDQDGKGPSIWDHFSHQLQKGHPRTGSSVGMVMDDMASDSYALWEKDLEAIQYLGVKFYAFSLSWPRLFPDGNATGRPNHAAVEHYSRLIGRLRGMGVEPVVTLFHWDLPQRLQEQLDGWTNPAMVQIFTDYAQFCFRTFGQEVRYWMTMHNPLLIAALGYGTGAHAPGEPRNPAVPFIVAHNLIRAHARTWHVYNDEYRPHQRGLISITLGSHWVEPFKRQATPANVELCQKSMEAVIGWFAEPIHGSGDYPRSLQATHQGLIPKFTPEEKLWVHGTADFFSLSFGPDTVQAMRGQVRFGQMGVLDLRKVLGWVQQEYGDPQVLVAESGWFSNASVGVEDTITIYVMKKLINQVLQAMVVENVKVFGYTAWSLVDGIEWTSGYTIRRGLFYIDFDLPQRVRIPKTSAQYYRQIVKDNGFTNNETDQNIRGHFPCDFHFGVADFIQQVQHQPTSPQFTDPHVYRWNFSGDGALHPVAGVTLQTRASQCTDFLAIQRHMHLLEVTGSSHYRFALDWAQLLPQGDASSADEEVVRFYRCMLTELRKRGIQAAATLYHPSFTSPTLGLPTPLHAQDGWMNTSIVEAFAHYSTFCYREFGALVSVWITINEPNRLTEVYSGSGRAVERHLLLAHARAWKVYHTHFRQQGGQVSFAVHADWVEPANPFLKSHASTVQHFLLFELGRFLDPFLRDLACPDKNRQNTCYEYLETGPLHLPYFSEEERRELRGALDFIALNHFTTRLVYPRRPDVRQGPQAPAHEHGCSFMADPTWPASNKGQTLTPWGLRRVLVWVKNRYGDTRSIVVTATGIDDQAAHDDQLRQTYIRSYLQEALKARELDGIDLRGFYVWKLQDRHAPEFGFFTSSHHRARAKLSVSVYRDLVLHRGFLAPGVNPALCERSDRQAGCWLCARMAENNPLVFSCVCLTACVLVLAGAIVAMAIRRKRKRRSKRKMVQAVAPLPRRQQVFAMQRMECRV
ncbi:beta-klotho [Brachyhypopomus gauderio]|uniref:beta-klotho n=1 Tax=Brachyhypopomus gauderio TaxID=698409 RepID=UPI0040432ED0